MNYPLTYVYGNCVFAHGLDDPWAVFVVSPTSYAWMDRDAKRSRFMSLVAALEALESDLQLIRVSRRWTVDRYDPSTPASRRRGHSLGLSRYVTAHRQRIAELGTERPEVFIVVSLSDPERDVATYVSRAASQDPRQWWSWLRGALGRDRRALDLSEL